MVASAGGVQSPDPLRAIVIVRQIGAFEAVQTQRKMI